MLVLTDQLVVVQQVNQSLYKAHNLCQKAVFSFPLRERAASTLSQTLKHSHLLVVRHVVHGQSGSLASSAVSHALHLDEVRLANANQVSIAVDFIIIPGLDHREAVYRALTLRSHHH